jgi:molybdate transport repressor ModE-like protein
LDWDDFRVFTTVARVGSYTRAARELGLTQPAVSRRIARLESAIGTKLFNRGTGGVELTAEGARVLNYANAAEFALTRAATLVREDTENVRGNCKLAVGDGLGAYWMPRFMGSFFAANPNIELTLYSTLDRGDSKKALFDLQIQYMEPMEPNYVALRLGTLHFVLFASADYIAKWGAPESVEDFGQHDILDLSLALTDKGMLASWAGVANVASLFTNSSVTLGEAVRWGGGIGLLPTYAALVDPALVPVMPALQFHAPVFVSFDREVGAKQPVRRTIDYLKNIVFNRRRMPWFFDEYVAPEKNWPAILTECLEQAAENDRDPTGS